MQYLVTIASPSTGDTERIRVHSDCPHGMQRFIDGLAASGVLTMANPLVTEIDGRSIAYFGSCDAQLAS